MIKIGILGAAKIAPKGIIWPAQERDDCKVFAVASRSPDRAKAFAEEYNVPHALSDYHELVSRDDVDLIYNALPPNRHADLTIAALEAGKSVLCEKPFAMNASEAKAMVSAAEASEGHLLEAFHYRFHPAALALLDIIHSGKIGPLKTISGLFNVSIANTHEELRYIPELGGGAMMDLGCYVLHFMRLISQSEAVVKSADAIRDTSGVDVAMKAKLRFKDIEAQLECDMREGTERIIKMTIEGEKGEVSFDQYVHPYRGFDIKFLNDEVSKTLSNNDDPKRYNQSTYAYQLDHVIAVLKGEQVPLTGGLDAVRTMQTMDSIYRGAGFDR